VPLHRGKSKEKHHETKQKMEYHHRKTQDDTKTGKKRSKGQDGKKEKESKSPETLDGSPAHMKTCLQSSSLTKHQRDKQSEGPPARNSYAGNVVCSHLLRVGESLTCSHVLESQDRSCASEARALPREEAR